MFFLSVVILFFCILSWSEPADESVKGAKILQHESHGNLSHHSSGQICILERVSSTVNVIYGKPVGPEKAGHVFLQRGLGSFWPLSVCITVNLQPHQGETNELWWRLAQPEEPGVTAPTTSNPPGAAGS